MSEKHLPAESAVEMVPSQRMVPALGREGRQLSEGRTRVFTQFSLELYLNLKMQ